MIPRHSMCILLNIGLYRIFSNFPLSLLKLRIRISIRASFIKTFCRKLITIILLFLGNPIFRSASLLVNFLCRDWTVKTHRLKGEVSTLPSNSRNGNRKSNEKISFLFSDLNGEEKTFCKQAITLIIKHSYGLYIKTCLFQ